MKYNFSNFKSSPIDGYFVAAVKTELITDRSDICEIINNSAVKLSMPEDILIISEKALAISQGRAMKLSEIKPSFLAKLLCRFVKKTKNGIGLGIPETMQIAIRDCGVMRILFAAFLSAIFKTFRIRGIFYVIAGLKAFCIDGPTNYTIPPYNEYVVPMPDKPQKNAEKIMEKTGLRILVVDINNLGGRIIGDSCKCKDHDLILSVLKNNPLGQSDESTPIGLIRKV